MSLSALLERVEGATGPDREIDAAICEALHSSVCKPVHRGTHRGEPVWRHPDFGLIRCEPYTESVDAALALIGRVFPGWSWSLTVHPSDTPKAARAGWDTVCTIYRLDDDYAVERTPGYFSHKSPALALCAALLAAMIGEEAKPSPPSTVTP